MGNGYSRSSSNSDRTFVKHVLCIWFGDLPNDTQANTIHIHAHDIRNSTAKTLITRFLVCRIESYWKVQRFSMALLSMHPHGREPMQFRVALHVHFVFVLGWWWPVCVHSGGMFTLFKNAEM